MNKTSSSSMTSAYLHEIHSCLLPSEATCFNALRVCLGQNGNFVKLSTMKQMSCELVSSRRAPFKIVTPKPEPQTPPNKEAGGAAGSHPPSAVSPAAAAGPEETELIVSNDVIGGDGEDWEDWSYLGGERSAVEAIAVRRIRRQEVTSKRAEEGGGEAAPTPAAQQQVPQTATTSSYFLLYILRNVTQHQQTRKHKQQQSRASGGRKSKSGDAASSQPSHQGGGGADAGGSPSSPTPQRQVIQLNYSPLVLHLTYLPRSSVMTLSLLVSSNDDSSIRLYQPLGDNNGPFEEVTDMGVKEKMLPNFWSSFPSPILTIDTTMAYDEDSSTYSNYAAVGCKDGNIRVVSFTPRSLLSRTYTFYVDGPIAAVQLRTRKSFVDGMLRDKAVHLNVASLSGFACVYRQDVYASSPRLGGGPDDDDTKDRGEGGNYYCCGDFVGPDVLEETVDEDDPVMCIYEASFPTLAGSCILVGTYKGRLMIFEEGQTPEEQDGKRAVLRGSRALPRPIYKLGVGDMNSDGIPEVVVLTKSAVHVFARSFGDIAEVALQRLKMISHGEKVEHHAREGKSNLGEGE